MDTYMHTHIVRFYNPFWIELAGDEQSGQGKSILYSHFVGVHGPYKFAYGSWFKNWNAPVLKKILNPGNY